jgi:hypothetical protein
MSKKVWAAVAIVLLIVIIIVSYNWDKMSFNVNVFQEPKIEKSDWTVVTSVKPEDTSHVLVVTYQEKYGLERTVQCKAVFENVKTAEYKCVSPELGSLLLQKSNLNSFSSKLMSRDSL